MKLIVNLGLLTGVAFDKLKTNGLEVEATRGRPWLLAVTLSNGQKVAAYPISRINTLAPPAIYMTDEACTEGIDNRETAQTIYTFLRQWCTEEDRMPAVKLLKQAITLLENTTK